MTWWCSGGDTVTPILPSIDSGSGDPVNPFLFSSIDSVDGCGDTVGVIFLLYIDMKDISEKYI